MNWKKGTAAIAVFIIMMGQLVGTLTVFAEAIEGINNDEMYFEKDGQFVSDLSITEGEKQTVTFVDTNNEDTTVTIDLPSSLQLDSEATNQVLGDATAVHYDATSNQVTVELNQEKQETRRANLVLKAMNATENSGQQFYANVIRENNQAVRSNAVMVVVNAAIQTADVETSDTANNEESGTDDGELPSSVITPTSGDLNVDLDISPVVNSVSSGEDALFYLQFKVTGSQTVYNNAKITVDLPAGFELSSNLADLSIAGITPTVQGNQLVWDMGTVYSGQAYVTKIAFKTVNGTTPDKTPVNVSSNFTADEFTGNAQDDATVTVRAGSSLSTSKKYKETFDENGDKKDTPPTAGDTGVWSITASAATKDKGLLYFKEGSKIKIVDTLPAGMTYVSSTDNGIYDAAAHTVTWEYDAPTIAEQQNATNYMFTKTVEVTVKFNDDIENFQVFSNQVRATGTDINDSEIVSNATASVNAGISDPSEMEGSSGSTWVLQHIGPLDGVGDYGNLTNMNPDPVVYDSAELAYVISIAPNQAKSPNQNMTKYEINYEIDPNLNLDRIYVPSYTYSPSSGDWDGHDLIDGEHPDMDIYVTIDGIEQKIVTGAEDFMTYTLSDLGIPKGTHVESIRYHYNFAPAGMHALFIRMYYAIEPGTTGRVINRVVYNIEGYNAKGDPVTVDTSEDSVDPNTSSGERYAEVIAQPSEPKLVAQSEIAFDTSASGIVKPGENRITGAFKNLKTSTLKMNGKLEATVLLPEGVKVNTEDPNYRFTNQLGKWDASNTFINANPTIVTDNYNGTNRQLVLIEWTANALAPDQKLSYGFNVIIDETAPSPLHMDTYGYSGDDELTVAAGGSSLTDSFLETDTDDMNGDGNSTQKRVLSSNEYTMIKTNSIVTSKLVKGELDSGFSKMGHTSVGGNIDYRLEMTNNGAKVGTFTMMEVLPSVGDLGITDNVARDSQFTPSLTGPVSIPSSWEGKSTVKYSTATNPSRSDLDKNVIYPETTDHLADPANAQAPNWVTADQVTDWSQIHSFIIEMDGADWVTGESVTFDFSMKAPEAIDVALTNEETPEAERAAWNSFAYTANNLQVVEPARVGVVVNGELPEITKDIEGEQHLDLSNRYDEFNWNVNTAFGDTTASWEQAVIKDQINDLLDITNVTVVDENGKDVTGNGNLTIENNLITFAMDKQDDSYAYLSGHTYTMTITTKIKDSATAEDLAPYIEDGGIPNQAELGFGNEGDVIYSEIPTVTPPTPEVPGIEKDVEEQQHLDLTNRDDAFDWHVNTTFGDTTSSWEQAVIKDQVNELLDITNVTIVDEKGNDVTANGTLTTENNLVLFTMNKQDDSFKYLSGHTYKMTITTKIKDSVTDEELAPYIKEGGIPNQAELGFGNEGDFIYSEKPTVTPPPVNPGIDKDIEEEQHLNLTNRDQEFDWHVNASFGNTTASWTQASIVDQVNDLLDIKAVTVVDEKGNDVTANGTLTTENNKVVFNINQKDGSYTYLAGHTYTMTITTTIRSDVSDEELAPYIEEGGIPNQADLNFGNNGDVIHSEKPTVTPYIPGMIILEKVDEDTGATLAGAVFELQDANGKVLEKNLQTNAAGQIILNNIEAGDYQFVETKAPAGYILDTTPVKFSVKNGNTAEVQLKKTNKQDPETPGNPSNPENPNTPDHTNAKDGNAAFPYTGESATTVLWMIGMLNLFVAGFIIISKKWKQKEA